jgi:2,4-diaminopentanoate dehydrogenase
MGKIRVMQYGVGPIGAGMVRLMLTKPAIEIVGAIDVDPKKVGKDLGIIAGAEREIGVKISSDSKAVLRSGADVVVHTTLSHLKSVAGQLTDCLSAGLHVVSTCEELSYPFRKHPELSKHLDEVARQHKVVLLGTGVNPGFVLDKLILTLATACQKVTHASGHRIVNASARRQPLQAKIGSGMAAEEFHAQVKAGVIKHHGLPESVGMVADGLGLEVVKIEEVIEPVIAKERVKTDYFDVPKGKVVGVRQVGGHGEHQGHARPDPHRARRNPRRPGDRRNHRKLHSRAVRNASRIAHVERHADVLFPGSEFCDGQGRINSDLVWLQLVRCLRNN